MSENVFHKDDNDIDQKPPPDDIINEEIPLPKFPLIPESWIEQIIEEHFEAIFGDPASPHMYINLTLAEIKKRFIERTHINISDTKLWFIMRNMGYSKSLIK